MRQKDPEQGLEEALLLAQDQCVRIGDGIARTSLYQTRLSTKKSCTEVSYRRQVIVLVGRRVQTAFNKCITNRFAHVLDGKRILGDRIPVEFAEKHIGSRTARRSRKQTCPRNVHGAEPRRRDGASDSV